MHISCPRQMYDNIVFQSILDSIFALGHVTQLSINTNTNRLVVDSCFLLVIVFSVLHTPSN